MPLHLVATPIGNLSDITLRALDVLKGADVILAEDTRRTRVLLARHGVDRTVVRYDDHVHRRDAPSWIERLAAGASFALVTDAGTPGVSDPGARLAAEAAARGIPVIPVPGASAVLAALAGSGLAWDRFTFLGFLSRRPGRLKRELTEAAERTLVFFESPHRLVRTLEAAQEVLGDAPAAVGRELTKVHEEFLRGRLSEIVQVLRSRGPVRGEITVVIAPPREKP